MSVGQEGLTPKDSCCCRSLDLASIEVPSNSMNLQIQEPHKPILVAVNSLAEMT